jgi:ComF family protein
MMRGLSGIWARREATRRVLGVGCNIVCDVARRLVRVIAPEYCAACDAPVREGVVFCELCGPCPRAPTAIALSAGVGGAYAAPLSTAIRRFKFGQRTDLASKLSLLLPSAALAPGTLVVPVPLHPLRLVERGFNAPALLARRWCRVVGGEFVPGALTRWRDTPHQSRLSAEERAENVAGAFVANERAAGRQAVLIDDVITTGATLEACRRALYAAGVVHVTVVALAATPLARG